MACAQTGSGKTGAFLIPILSKLLQKLSNPKFEQQRNPPGARRTKAAPLALLILPTRELAIQIFDETRRVRTTSGGRMKLWISQIYRMMTMMVTVMVDGVS